MHAFGREISRERERMLLGLRLKDYFQVLARQNTTGNSEKSYYTRENVIIVHCLPPQCTDLSNTVY